MRTPIVAFFLLVGATTAPHTARAQSRWKEIGKTANGNSVYVDPKTVRTVNGITTARIRVKFTPPVAAGPNVTWASSQHIAMFNCAKSTVASKETVYYADEAGTKVVERKTIAIPGYGTAIGGSMTKLALDYFRAAKPKS